MQASPIRSVQFRREREASWRELEDLIALANQNGLRSLSPHQLARLPHLYRSTLSALSVARTISLDAALVPYLESLVGRAYFVVYGTRSAVSKQLRTYFGVSLPMAFRQAKGAMALAAIAMLVPALAAFLLTLDDMDRFYTFVGGMAQGRTPASTTAALREQLYDSHDVSGKLNTFAATLFSHNTRIAIMVFALGFLAGIPTLLLLAYNGVTLGGFVALYHSRGLGVDIWGWLLPHGITELLAVIVAGGAGLTVASAVVFPGIATRRAALRRAGKLAGQLVVGAACMLLMAGLIEGIFRQTVTNIHVRYLVALTTAVFWIWYFGFAGRRAEAELAVAAPVRAAGGRHEG